MWEIYHLNDRRIVLEFFFQIRIHVGIRNKLQWDNLFFLKILLYFLPKQFCTHLWFIKKLEWLEKFKIFGIQENMIATNLKKLLNDNTIIKSGGCKIRLYILTNMRWVHFSQNSFKQFWWMHTSWEKIPVHILEVSISSLIWYKFDRGIFFQR